MDFPKKQAQRLMPLYLLEYSEKLFTNHPDPSAPWGGAGGSDYTAGQGITITNNEISVDTNVIATKSDIPTNYVTLDTSQTITGTKWFNYLHINSPDDSGTLDVNCDSLFFNNPSTVNTKESFSIYASTENYGPGFFFSTGEENPTINYYVFPHLDLPGEHHYTLATTDDIITSYNDLTDKPTIPDASDFVTTNTEQTITGSKTFASNLYIKSTNSTTSLGLEDYTLYFDNTSSGEIFQILPYKNFWGPGFYYGVGNDALAMNYYVLPHQDLPGEYRYTLATTNDIPSLTGYATETWVQNQGYATSSEIPTNYVTTDTAQTITGLKTIGQTDGTISEVDFSGFTFKLSNKAINHPEADINIRNASYDGYQHPIISSTKGLYVNLAKIRLGDDGNNIYGITMPDSSTWEADRVLATTNDIPTKTSELTNDSGYITNITSSDITNALGYTPGTSNFSGSYNDLTDKPDLSIYAQSSNLSTVATTGSYNDLTDKPTLATVATSGSYNDLTDKPNIFPAGRIVDIDTRQNITGRKTFEGDITVKHFTGAQITSILPDTFDYTSVDPVTRTKSRTKFKLPTSKPKGTEDSPTEYTLATTDDIPSIPVLSTVATSGNYNDLTNKPAIPSTATSTSTSTVTPTTGTFVTGTSTNTTNVVNSVTYTPSSETLTFTYADNTTASFTFLTSNTTVTSGTTSVVSSVTDSTSNAMTGATVSTSTTTTLS